MQLNEIEEERRGGLDELFCMIMNYWCELGGWDKEWERVILEVWVERMVEELREGLWGPEGGIFQYRLLSWLEEDEFRVEGSNPVYRLMMGLSEWLEEGLALEGEEREWFWGSVARFLGLSGSRGVDDKWYLEWEEGATWGRRKREWTYGQVLERLMGGSRWGVKGEVGSLWPRFNYPEAWEDDVNERMAERVLELGDEMLSGGWFWEQLLETGTGLGYRREEELEWYLELLHEEREYRNDLLLHWMWEWLDWSGIFWDGLTQEDFVGRREIWEKGLKWGRGLRLDLCVKEKEEGRWCLKKQYTKLL